MLGKIIHGYEIVLSYKDKYVIAYNPKAVDPFVLWSVDYDGNGVHSGYYTKSFCNVLHRLEEKVVPEDD